VRVVREKDPDLRVGIPESMPDADHGLAMGISSSAQTAHIAVREDALSGLAELDPASIFLQRAMDT
jgi:hypothetical protein